MEFTCNIVGYSSSVVGVEHHRSANYALTIHSGLITFAHSSLDTCLGESLSSFNASLDPFLHWGHLLFLKALGSSNCLQEMPFTSADVLKDG